MKHSFKTGQGTNLADIMENVGLGEIMQPTANYGKISEKPVQVDAINHKVSNYSFILHSSYNTETKQYHAFEIKYRLIAFLIF